MIRGGSESEAAKGKVQLYIGFDLEHTVIAILQHVELFTGVNFGGIQGTHPL